jgi:hypothetical protein
LIRKREEAGCDRVRRVGNPPRIRGESPEPWSQRVEEELVLTEENRDSAELHQQNFLDCIRSRTDPNGTVEIAAAAVAAPQYGQPGILARQEDHRIEKRQAS